MVAAQPWRKPELSDQPGLKRLNDELHDLRLDAGLLSARAIRDRIGRDVHGSWIVNHQAVLDAFQRPEIPRWGSLELIVGTLAEAARRNDVDDETIRFKDLWKKATAEVVAHQSVKPPAGVTAYVDDDVQGGDDGFSFGDIFDHIFDKMEDQVAKKGGEGQTDTPPTRSQETTADEVAASFNYAHESLKALIINAAQALWDDKDALRVFLGVVRRSEGFAKMADAAEEHRPANATFYGVKSREFRIDPSSPARHELVALHRCLDKHRLKRQWSFTDLEKLTGISSDTWIRWYTQESLPDREALTAFAREASLMLEDRVLLLGLWDAAYDALNTTPDDDSATGG